MLVCLAPVPLVCKISVMHSHFIDTIVMAFYCNSAGADNQQRAKRQIRFFICENPNCAKMVVHMGGFHRAAHNILTER